MTPYKPGFWETPRNIAILTAVLCTIAAAVSSYVAYGIGRELARPSRPWVIVIQLQTEPPK